MVHENRNGIKLYDYVKQLMDVFGENATVAFCYLLSTLFRDVIFRRTRHFPILNLFGEREQERQRLPLHCRRSFYTEWIHQTLVSLPYLL